MKVSFIILFTALLVASALWETTEARRRPAAKKTAARKPAAKKAVSPMHVHEEEDEHKDHVHCTLDKEELEVGQERYLMVNGEELGCSKVVCKSDGLVAKFEC